MKRELQEKIIETLVNNLKEGIIDSDLIDQLKNNLNDNTPSKILNYQKFINLYNEANKLKEKLEKDRFILSFDIWQFFWNKLFEKNGYRDKAFKIYPFSYCDVDSSCEDEANWFMFGWERACNEVQKLIDMENYMKEFYNEIND